MSDAKIGGNAFHCMVKQISKMAAAKLTEHGRAAGREVLLEGRPGEARPSRPRVILNSEQLLFKGK